VVARVAVPSTMPRTVRAANSFFMIRSRSSYVSLSRVLQTINQSALNLLVACKMVDGEVPTGNNTAVELSYLPPSYWRHSVVRWIKWDAEC